MSILRGGNPRWTEGGGKNNTETYHDAAMLLDGNLTDMFSRPSYISATGYMDASMTNPDGGWDDSTYYLLDKSIDYLADKDPGLLDAFVNTEVEFKHLSVEDKANGVTHSFYIITGTRPIDGTMPSVSYNLMKKYGDGDTGTGTISHIVSDELELKDTVNNVFGGQIKTMDLIKNPNGTAESLYALRISVWADQNDPFRADLQVGADSGQRISVDIGHLNARGLKLNGASVRTVSGADDCINRTREAVKIVNESRSRLGAIQNRLEHTINNLNNIAENTEAADSAIRDTDMASEMVRFANQQVLEQAGVAMLSQANQLNQNILSLLQ